MHCIDPAGELLGKILVPSTVSNLAFGGRNGSRLFLCASHTLYAIYTNVRGAPLPVSARSGRSPASAAPSRTSRVTEAFYRDGLGFARVAPPEPLPTAHSPPRWG